MIGILGGTFDPIHFGHLRPAQETARAVGLTELRVIPAGLPPHRRAVASAEQRLAMARLACRDFPGFTVDDREVRRAVPSYTVDTLTALRGEIGDRSLSLLMGSDAFNGLETWHAWQRLPELAHLIVMHRPGSVLLPLPAWAQKRRAERSTQLRDSAAGRIWLQLVTPQEISGTLLRAAIGRGEPTQEWLPPSVSEYIRDHKLYEG
jgi:nicotinate-nucleotide adenylyltransferase